MSLRRIGTVLSEMRSRKGMTQVDLAKKAKVSQAYIARMESGDKKKSLTSHLTSIGDRMQGELETLMERGE